MTKVQYNNHSRVAKNTFMLYIRQAIAMLVGFYTVRIVLSTLGIEDYGVYNVVTGVVTMLNFLSGTMASSNQRFFSYYLGKDDTEKYKQVFSATCIIYVIMIVILFLLLESVGLWFVKEHLSIPEGRETAVLFIFQFSIISFLISIASSPFVTSIIAHEDMQIFAYISIVDAILKLSVAFMLQYIDFDKLELYAILSLASSSIIAILYIIICLRRYPECQLRKIYWDYSIFMAIIKYTGWTLLGNATSTARVQGVTILMNQYFSPVIVASRVIASQISNTLSTFSTNFSRSLYPQVIKSYSSGKFDTMYKQVYSGTKIAFFLMWILLLPLWIYMDEILSIWLDVVPQRAALFARLAVIDVLIQTSSYSITTAARASEKLKGYELIISAIQMLFFGTVWYMLSLSSPDYSVYIAVIVLSIAMFITRLIFANRLTQMPIMGFITDVLLHLGLVVICSLLPFILLSHIVPYSFINMLAVMALGTLINFIVIYLVGLNSRERVMVGQIILIYFTKMR